MIVFQFAILTTLSLFLLDLYLHNNMINRDSVLYSIYETNCVILYPRALAIVVISTVTLNRFRAFHPIRILRRDMT